MMPNSKRLTMNLQMIISPVSASRFATVQNQTGVTLRDVTVRMLPEDSNNELTGYVVSLESLVMSSQCWLVSLGLLLVHFLSSTPSTFCCIGGCSFVLPHPWVLVVVFTCCSIANNLTRQHVVHQPTGCYCKQWSVVSPPIRWRSRSISKTVRPPWSGATKKTHKDTDNCQR
jgi:hypothetical protein